EAIPLDGEPLADETLPASVERHMTRYFHRFGDDLPPPRLYHRVVRDLEERLIGAALAATRGNQIKAAELLGLNRNTLRKKIRDLGIKVIRTPGPQLKSLAGKAWKCVLGVRISKSSA